MRGGVSFKKRDHAATCSNESCESHLRPRVNRGGGGREEQNEELADLATALQDSCVVPRFTICDQRESIVHKIVQTD